MSNFDTRMHGRPGGFARTARLLIAMLAAAQLTLVVTAQGTPEATAAELPLVAIENVNYFDGVAVVGPVTVLLEDGVISAVGANVATPADARVLDGAGHTLLPGLIDAHVHTFTPQMLEQALMFGVTTVYDMFTAEQFAAQMREEQEAGAAHYRADLLSAGTLATAPGGHGTQFGLDITTLTEPSQAEEWVADRAAAGADYIKVIIEDGHEMDFSVPTLDEETVTAVIAAAHDQGLMAITHVQTLAAAEMAVRAGTDGLGHMFSDALPTPELVEEMVAKDVFVIPTLSVFQSVGVEDEVDTSLAADERIAPFLTPADLQSLANPFTDYPQLAYANASDGVATLHEAGVRILAGTDAPNPGTAFGASMHRELELLVQSGLTASEALAAATSVNADTFGQDGIGSIEPGMTADLLLVRGDPTDDITATRDIVAVFKGGVMADRDSYRQAIADAQAQAEASAAQQAEELAVEGPVLVSDFESGDTSVSFGHAWQPTTDEQAGGNSTAAIAVVEGGANGSGYALEVTGTVGEQFALPWGGTMFMPGAQPFGPADLSSRPVLSFNVQGQPGTYRVQLFCQNTGQVPPEQTFDVGEEWSEVRIDLSQVGGCDVAGLMAVIFSAQEPGEYRFLLDDVTFEGASAE